MITRGKDWTLNCCFGYGFVATLSCQPSQKGASWARLSSLGHGPVQPSGVNGGICLALPSGLKIKPWFRDPSSVLWVPGVCAAPPPSWWKQSVCVCEWWSSAMLRVCFFQDKRSASGIFPLSILIYVNWAFKCQREQKHLSETLSGGRLKPPCLTKKTVFSTLHESRCLLRTINLWNRSAGRNTKGKRSVGKIMKIKSAYFCFWGSVFGWNIRSCAKLPFGSESAKHTITSSNKKQGDLAWNLHE